MDSGADIPVIRSPFLSNINDNSILSSDLLIEEKFDDDDINYMANIFYSHKQDIEKSSYISSEELKIFYECSIFEEYYDCNE